MPASIHKLNQFPAHPFDSSFEGKLARAHERFGGDKGRPWRVRHIGSPRTRQLQAQVVLVTGSSDA